MLYAAWKQGAFQDRLSHLDSAAVPTPAAEDERLGVRRQRSFSTKMAPAHASPAEKSCAKPAYSVTSMCVMSAAAEQSPGLPGQLRWSALTGSEVRPWEGRRTQWKECIT